MKTEIIIAVFITAVAGLITALVNLRQANEIAYLKKEVGCLENNEVYIGDRCVQVYRSGLEDVARPTIYKMFVATSSCNGNFTTGHLNCRQ